MHFINWDAFIGIEALVDFDGGDFHSLTLSLAPYHQPAKIPPFYLAFIIRVRRAFAVNVENAFFRSVRFSTNFDIIATVASSHRLLLVLV